MTIKVPVNAINTKNGYPIQVGTFKTQSGILFGGSPANSGTAGAQVGTTPVALTINYNDTTLDGEKIAGVRLRWSADVLVQYTADPADGSFPVDADTEYVWFPAGNETLYVDATGAGTDTFYEITTLEVAGVV